MAVDVYNDTRLETVSARSWPSRSLAQMHADSCVARLADLGHDVPFEPFAPGGKILHCRDPVAYLEMQECIADDLVHDLVKELESCLVCSFQVDGSSNKCQVDQKYVSCRYVNAGEDTPKTRFIRVTEAEQRGAPGLLEAFCKAFDGKDNCGIGLSTETLQEKIIGLSTDGENANTGRKAGFWVLLEKQLQKKLMLVWCVCHRSDLAYEFVQSCVPELRHWRTNLTSLCSYFRRSSMKTKLLKKTASSVNDSVEESDEGEEQEHSSGILRFPAVFEVRMAEHLLHVCRVVLNNLPHCKKLWSTISASSDFSRQEQAEASGFLKTWDNGGLMVKMTAFMSDILEIEKTTQKKFQASDLIITDIPKFIAKSQQAMSLVANGSFPGGEEEKVMNVHLEDQNQTAKRQVINKYVTFARDWSAIRNDLIESFQNFYGEKMNVEQEDLLRSILQFLRSSSVETMIETGRALIKDYFGEKFIQPFALEVIDFFQDFPEYSSITDDTERVRFLARAQRGHISRLAAAILTVSPHSMTVERIVSHQNTFFDCRRTRTTLRGLNSKLTIALNGKGTAFFDPRSAVSRFLSKKRRREREPTEKYRNRDFVRQFFSSDPAIRHGTVSMGHLYFGSPGLKM